MTGTRVPVTVDSRVRIPIAALPPAVADALRAALTRDNPRARDPNRRGMADPTVRTWRHDGPDLSLPRGAFRVVREQLAGAGLLADVQDRRTWQNPAPDFPDHLLVPWEHQGPVIEASVAAETGLVRAIVGSGKTTCAFAVGARLKRRTLVLVWTGNLLTQWVERAAEELGLGERDVGVLGGGEKDRIRDLTVGMQQTIHSRIRRGATELLDAFDVVQVDEVQRFAADTLYETLDPFAARYRLGYSSDETRRDGLEFMIYDLFGDVVAEVHEGELIASGKIVPVEMAVLPTSFQAPWYRYRQDFNRLLAQMVEDEDRNTLGIRAASGAVREGHQVLLFTHRVEHARQLDARLNGLGIRSGCMLGGAENSVPFDRTKRALKSGEFRAGVGTYQAIAQGLDLPSVDRGVCMTPIGNNRQMLGQVRGRICRSSEGKQDGRLCYLLDRAVYGTKPVRNFLQWGHATRVFSAGAWHDAAEWLKPSLPPFGV